MPGREGSPGRSHGRVLHMDADALAFIRRHAADDYPRECCGILAGRRFPDGSRRVVWVRRAANIVEDMADRRYEIDPRDLLRADKDAREQGLEILGYYHSHPDGTAEPSELDAQRAWPDYSYVIVAIREGIAQEVRSWVFDEALQRFLEERVVITAAASHREPVAGVEGCEPEG